MSTPTRVLAVIPAAGAGTRLGRSMPKALVEIDADTRIVDVVLDAVAPHADGVALVVAPNFEENLARPLVLTPACPLLLRIQESPTGMCDALRCSEDLWADYDCLAVVWGDQVNVSTHTVARAIQLHGGRTSRIVIPTVERISPYVQYIFGDSNLIDVREAREGHAMDPAGRSDVGVFIISASELAPLLDDYEAYQARSVVTGELNLLPFFPHAARRGWLVEQLDIVNVHEAIGVNTQDELDFAASRIRGARQ